MSSKLNEDFVDEELPCQVNSKYHDSNQCNAIKHDHCSSFSPIHTNLASINKHFDELQHILSKLKTDFDIGISEHKISSQNETPVNNINLPLYHPFVFDTSQTNYGGTGIYVKESIVFNKREDLKIYSPGDFESTFIELVLPNKRNMIVGCLYRHPNSSITIKHFKEDY